MKVLLLTLSLLFAPLFEPLLAAQTAPASSSREDDKIEDLVKVRLAGNRDTGGLGSIKVAVKAGVVTLSGKVEVERQKSAAAKEAKKVKGVKSVVNELAVVPR